MKRLGLIYRCGEVMYRKLQIYKGDEVMTVKGSLMGLAARKPVFGGLQTTKTQTSLHMRAD